jgi:hypothetical protein
MTSGGADELHTSASAPHPRPPDCSEVAMKPSILPLSMSARDESALCSAPPFTWLESWYGYAHPPLRGSGAQTVNCPPRAGSPSAPGNVPK